MTALARPLSVKGQTLRLGHDLGAFKMWPPFEVAKAPYRGPGSEAGEAGDASGGSGEGGKAQERRS